MKKKRPVRRKTWRITYLETFDEPVTKDEAQKWFAIWGSSGPVITIKAPLKKK